MAPVSEYQWYEFVALDRPLTATEMGELRAISTRAEITPTRFWNEYQWGDLKADPAELLARYFDVHLYFANWGTRRLMFRLPRRAVDAQALRAYAPGGAATLTTRRDHVILDLSSDTDEPDDDWFEGGHLAASLTPLRADLLAGDHRAAYLAWLLAVQTGEVDEATPEPPVPAGLTAGAAGLAALAEFLRLDRDLLTVATTASPAATDDTGRFTDWVRGLPASEQQRWLLRAAADPDLRIGAALLAEFRHAHPPATGRSQRTVAELLAAADALCEERDRQAERQAAQAHAAAAAAEQARLAELARRGDAAWQELEQLVETRAYDQAVRLVLDLRQLAARAGEQAAFDARVAGLRQRYSRRRGFLDRLGRAAADTTGSGAQR
jgi:hypothetical protein